MDSLCCFAPGRVELLGNHTDYNGGYVLSAAIPQGVRASGSGRSDGLIRLSTLIGEETLLRKVSADETFPFVKTGEWSDYPLAVLQALRDEGHRLGAFDASYRSDLPSGAGLSSSAALEVSTILLLSKLFGISLSGMDLARLCRHAENQFVGVRCGILDQVSSLFGKRDHAIFLDCLKEEVKLVSFPHDVSLLIVQCGIPHALVGGEYNARRLQCSEAARRLGVNFLRESNMAQLEKSLLPDLERRRAAHIIGENERVLRGVEFLESGNVADFGRLMTASHESSRVNFENSTPELDLLVSIAKSTSGVLGARLTGGGFGGAIVVLLSREDRHQAGSLIASEYERRSGHRAHVMECDLADGALIANGFVS
jgi:galactokinase